MMYAQDESPEQGVLPGRGVRRKTETKNLDEKTEENTQRKPLSPSYLGLRNGELPIKKKNAEGKEEINRGYTSKRSPPRTAHRKDPR